MHDDNNLEKFRVKEPVAAGYIAMSRSFLRLARMRGRGGPPYIRIGRAIRYDLRDLDRWLAERRVEG